MTPPKGLSPEQRTCLEITAPNDGNLTALGLAIRAALEEIDRQTAAKLDGPQREAALLVRASAAEKERDALKAELAQERWNHAHMAQRRTDAREWVFALQQDNAKLTARAEAAESESASLREQLRARDADCDAFEERAKRAELQLAEARVALQSALEESNQSRVNEIACAALAPKPENTLEPRYTLAEVEAAMARRGSGWTAPLILEAIEEHRAALKARTP